jgi:hypothetical protein
VTRVTDFSKEIQHGLTGGSVRKTETESVCFENEAHAEEVAQDASRPQPLTQ